MQEVWYLKRKSRLSRQPSLLKSAVPGPARTSRRSECALLARYRLYHYSTERTAIYCQLWYKKELMPKRQPFSFEIKEATLAGVPFSCVSRVSPVKPSACGRVRNPPPQRYLPSCFYYTNSLVCCKEFVCSSEASSIPCSLSS